MLTTISLPTLFNLSLPVSSRQANARSQTIQACSASGPTQEANPPSRERQTGEHPAEEARQASRSVAKPQVSLIMLNKFDDVFFLLDTVNVPFLNISPLFVRHNGEVPSTRPKSDFEPSLPTKPKTLSGDWGEKPSDTGG